MSAPTVGSPTVRQLDRQFLSPKVLGYHVLFLSYAIDLRFPSYAAPAIRYLSLVGHLGWANPNLGSIQARALRPVSIIT